MSTMEKSVAERISLSYLIGYLLCESCLSVMGDGFIHERLLSMVKQGKLAIVSAGENGSYRGQILRKNRT